MDIPVKPKRQKRRIILKVFAAAILCLAVVLVDGMGLLYPLTHITGDAMDWKSHYLAGFWSLNCGRVKIRGDATAATSCAVQADRSGKPFRVIYNLQGVDSAVAYGIVRTRSGKRLALDYDGCPMGCGFSFIVQRVEITPCPEPAHFFVNPRGHLDCQEEPPYASH